MSEKSTDLEKLLSAMDAFSEGNFEDVSAKDFEDPQVAEAYNRMLSSVMGRNNRFLMRLNDAMNRIADSSCVKNMFEQVELQMEPIRTLQTTRSDFANSADRLEELGVQILTVTRQMQLTIKPCVEMLRETMKLMGSIAADRGAEENSDFMRIRKEMERTVKTIRGMSERIETTVENAKNIVDEISMQHGLTKVFLNSVESIAGSYQVLSMECFNTGHHLYRISRDIDNARNDMFRQNSRITLHDKLKIFAIDHLTITWRLYNNMVEFELLKLEQVNNADRCKFGLWVSSVDHPLLRQSAALQCAAETHAELHRHAEACFLAKERTDISTAMKEFNLTLESLQDFNQALDQIHRLLYENDITDETSVWVFEG